MQRRYVRHRLSIEQGKVQIADMEMNDIELFNLIEYLIELNIYNI